jgi:translocator protein
LRFYAFHYVLNLLWAPLFFGLQRIRAAQVLNFFLLASLGSVMAAVLSISPLCSILLTPYFAWLSFATVLNGAICRLNPTVKGYNEAMLQAGIQRLRAEAGKRAGL